jgi:hypothetical protein
MKVLQFHRGIFSTQPKSVHRSGGNWAPRKRYIMASGSKEDPTPVKVEAPDSGLTIQDTVPIGERDGFGTLVDVMKGISDTSSCPCLFLSSQSWIRDACHATDY